MGCFLIIVGLTLPRVAILAIWLLSDWFTRVFGGWLLPVLGFVFLPYTTLAYTAAMVQTGGNLNFLWMAIVVVAAIADVGHWTGGLRFHRRRVIVVRQ